MQLQAPSGCPNRLAAYARCMVHANVAVQLEEQQLGGAQNSRHRHGLVPSQCLEERDSFVAPSPCHLERYHEEVTPAPFKWCLRRLSF